MQDQLGARISKGLTGLVRYGHRTWHRTSLPEGGCKQGLVADDHRHRATASLLDSTLPIPVGKELISIVTTMQPLPIVYLNVHFIFAFDELIIFFFENC